MAALERGDDSDKEEQSPDSGLNLFTDRANKAKSKAKRPPGLSLFTEKGAKNDDEVVESMSPGGHVNKRRARSRPVSRELRISL